MEGIDYDDTYSPIVKFPTSHVMLVLVVSKGWNIHQVNVDDAFLNEDLKEIVYMLQHPGFENKGHSTKVCQLHKSLYGL